jgi:hypothetical protein
MGSFIDIVFIVILHLHCFLYRKVSNKYIIGDSDRLTLDSLNNLYFSNPRMSLGPIALKQTPSSFTGFFFFASVGNVFDALDTQDPQPLPYCTFPPSRYLRSTDPASLFFFLLACIAYTPPPFYFSFYNIFSYIFSLLLPNIFGDENGLPTTTTLVSAPALTFGGPRAARSTSHLRCVCRSVSSPGNRRIAPTRFSYVYVEFDLTVADLPGECPFVTRFAYFTCFAPGQ